MKQLTDLISDWLEKQLPRLRRQRVASYAIALALSGAAIGLRYAIEAKIPPGLPFLTFFLALLLATILGGAGPGFLALVCSLFASWYLFFTPVRSFDSDSLVALAIFTLTGSLIVLVVHMLNTTVERLVRERGRGEALLQDSALTQLQLEQLNVELRHRTKNVFSVISAIITQAARYSASAGELAANVTSRMRAMASAQDLVAAGRFQGAALRQVANDTIGPISPPDAARLRIAGPDCLLPPDIATPIALVLHELATNAVKYGAWSNAKGRVNLSWTLAEIEEDTRRLTLTWEETAGPVVREPTHSGLGTTLIEKGVPGAKVIRTFGPKGLVCLVELDIRTVTKTTSRRA